MWFRKLVVKNVGLFADLSLDFTRGSVGIFGKNGTGKSTILNLLYAVITNDFGRFDGVKTDMIRGKVQGEKGAESWVHGEIEHNGTVLAITRNMKPTKTKSNTTLVIDGDAAKAITNADKAEEEIYKTLGIDRRLVDTYVFKEQHKIYDFLTSDPADRAKAYQTLCRTEECEKIWDMLGEFLNKDADVNVQITDNSDELQAAISEAEGELAILTERKAQAVEKQCEPKFVEKYTKIVKAQQLLEHLREQEPLAATKLTACQEALTKANKRLAARQGEYDEAKGKAEKREKKAEDTRAALKAWESYGKYRKRRKELKEENEALEEEAKKNKAPDKPDDVVEQVDTMVKQLNAWEEALDRATAAVDLFAKTGTTKCPTCATPVSDLKDYLAEMKKAATELPAKIKAYEQRIEAINEYKAAARKYEKWKAGYDARLKANQDARNALKEITAPDGDKDELRAWLVEYESKAQELGVMETELRERRNEVNRCEANLAAAQEKVNEIAAGIESSTAEPKKVEKAKRRLAEHAVATTEIASIDGEAKGINKVIDAKREELQKLRRKLKKNRKVRQMADVIRRVRDVMHRDRLPKRVAVLNLGNMEGDVNTGLQQFGEPFWVEANQELSFTVHKAGDPPQSAGRLSTGQRVVLALAFWPAVASLWSSDLGMLALDEPTANLDAENRKFLAEAMTAMTAKVRGNRQLIMVTHDPDLRTAFDQVIDLGA